MPKGFQSTYRGAIWVKPVPILDSLLHCSLLAVDFHAPRVEEVRWGTQGTALSIWSGI